jgi:hypothetical protein
MTSVWRRAVVRNGHRLETYDAVSTLKGRRGSLVFRERVEWLDAGDGYHPAAPSASSQDAGRVPSCGSQMYPQVTQFETQRQQPTHRRAVLDTPEDWRR